MSQARNPGLILILGLLAAIGPFSIDMYLPGFPVIAQHLDTTVEQVGYSLSSFFIGICCGQLITGPLLDRFGRKTPLIIGLVIYIVASMCCAISGSVEQLIAFRFLQALGGCVGMVAPNAIVRDLYPVHESARVFALLILILGISPILAPTAGGYLVTFWSWQIVFMVLALVTFLIMLAVIRWLPETRQPDPALSLQPRSILRSYRNVFKEPQFNTYAFAGAIASAGLFAYLAGSPYIFMELYQVSKQVYGWIFALLAAGLIASSQLNNLVLRKYNSAQILRTVQLIQSLAGIGLCAGTYYNVLGMNGTIGLIFLFLSCQGFTFPNSAALAMAPFSKGAGSASALMGSLQMAFGALASALAGIFFNGTALPMAAIMCGCCLIGYTILLVGQRKAAEKAKMEMIELSEAQALEMIEKY